MPDKDEFNAAYHIERAEASLERLQSLGSRLPLGDPTSSLVVTSRAQAEALVAIAKSLRRIESHVCDKAGGGNAVDVAREVEAAIV